MEDYDAEVYAEILGYNLNYIEEDYNCDEEDVLHYNGNYGGG